MNIITINGRTFKTQGKNLIISNDTIISNGTIIQSELSGIVEVKFEGDLASVQSDSAITIHGNVYGNVDAGNSVKCGNVEGNVDAGNSVDCGNVKGSVEAGNNIKINR